MNKTISKRINQMAIPILFTNLSGYLFTLGDQIIVGRLGISEYAAVTSISNLLYYLIGSMGILSVVLNILGSKNLGKNEENNYENLFNTAISLSVFIGAAFTLFCFLFGYQFLIDIMKMPVNVALIGMDYLKIASLSLGLNMLIFICSAYYKSQELPAIIVYSSIISNSINLILDYILVFGKLGFPKYGVKGAAIGTVVGLSINLIIYLVSMVRKSEFKLKIEFGLNSFKRIIKTYIPLLLQDLFEGTLFVFVLTSIISKLGTLPLALLGLVMTFQNFILQPAYAYGSSLISIVSKEYSKKNWDYVTSLIKISSKILMTILMGLILLMNLNPTIFAKLISNNEALQKSFVDIFPIVSIYLIVNSCHIIMKYVLNSMDYENWVFRITLFFSGIILASLYFLNNYLNMNIIFVVLTLNYLILYVAYTLKISRVLKTKRYEDKQVA